MITHKITPYQQASTKYNYAGVIGSQEHRQHILDVVVGECEFDQGDHVVINGDLGLVCTVYDKVEDSIEWDGYLPKPVEVFLYSEQECKLFHPKQLRRT